MHSASFWATPPSKTPTETEDKKLSKKQYTPFDNKKVKKVAGIQTSDNKQQ